MDAFNVYTSRFLEVIDSLKISDYQVWNNLESLSKGNYRLMLNSYFILRF